MGEKVVLPNNKEAEDALIGAMLTHPETVNKIMQQLTSKDFYNAANRKVVETIEKLISQSLAIDATTIIGAISTGSDETSWAEELINYVTSEYWHLENIDDYIQIIYDCSFRRNLIAFCKKAVNDAMKLDTIADEMRGTVLKEIKNITKGIHADDVPSIDETAKETYEQVAEGKDDTVIPTGYYDFDKKMQGGLRPKKKVVIGARSSMGKSALALDIAYNVAVKQWFPVLFFSLEMPRHDLMKRLFSIDTRIDQSRFGGDELTEDEKKALQDSVSLIGQSPLILYDKSGLTARDIRNISRKYKESHDIKLIIVDYLQYVSEMPGSGNRSREQAVASTMHELCETADELEVPIIILSQINRSVEGRKDKRPLMSDLRESGSIEQDADIIAALYRDDYYNPESKDKGVAELAVLKSRGGQTGMIKLSWMGQYTLFENLAFDNDEKPAPKKKKDNDGFMPVADEDEIPFK